LVTVESHFSAASGLNHNVANYIGQPEGHCLPIVMWSPWALLQALIHRAVLVACRQSFAQQLQPVSQRLEAVDQAWRRIPTGTIDVFLQDLKPTTRTLYLRALSTFDAAARHHGWPLLTLADLDSAVFRYVDQCSRAQAETVLSAIYKAYPSTKRSLPWSYAKIRVLSTRTPHVHHAPLPWLIAIEYAWVLMRLGLARRAGLVLLGWRFGLRPSEAVALFGSDLYPASRQTQHGALGFVRVGTQAGTKSGRPALVRAHYHDFWANWLLERFAATTPATSRLSDIYNYRGFHGTYRLAATTAGLPPSTPHVARAGWASWRYAIGQPVPELCEDGRWKSLSALRCYLDVISAVDQLAEPSVASRLGRLKQLESTLHLWLVW